MENASKALIMAAGVLIGILILSLAVYLFVDFGSTSADINAQNTERQLAAFNAQFDKYQSYKDDSHNWQNLSTIYDVITVAGYARENNLYHDNISENMVYVMLDDIEIQGDFDEKALLSNSNYLNENGQLRLFVCKIDSYHNNGRVEKIIFIQTNNWTS